ncbi:transposase family protein [Streptomyces sp. NPDC056400]|uniref:transposase family protein n=1 Tax=Streptomyces sp. NPDC056400 TaxID=3345808 RepID=UPI0035D57A8B
MIIDATGCGLRAAGCGLPGACPQCQHPGVRVHSRYWRHVAGLPVLGARLIVHLQVRRFFCDQTKWAPTSDLCGTGGGPDRATTA